MVELRTMGVRGEGVYQMPVRLNMTKVNKYFHHNERQIRSDVQDNYEIFKLLLHRLIHDKGNITLLIRTITLVSMTIRYEILA